MMTKDQKKAVLAMFVAGVSVDAIALALELPLDVVKSAVSKTPPASQVIPARAPRPPRPEQKRIAGTGITLTGGGYATLDANASRLVDGDGRAPRSRWDQTFPPRGGGGGRGMGT
jgi:hypothetical protein